VVEGEKIDWSMYGIDKSVVEITVKGKNGVEVRAQSGTQKSYDEGYYVSVRESNKVILVNPTWAGLVVKSVSEFRDMSLYRKDLGNAVELSLTNHFPGHQEEITFVKKDNQWKLKGRGRKIQLDSIAVATLVDDIKNLQAGGVVDEDKDAEETVIKHGLSQPLAVLSIKFKTGEKEKATEWKVRVGSKKGNKTLATVTGHPAVFRLNHKDLEMFNQVLEDFRDKKQGLSFEKQKVSKIWVKRPKLEMSFLKKDGDWTIKDLQEGLELDKEKIDKLINGIGDMEVARFLGERKAWGVTPPKNQVILKDAKGKSILDLKWGNRFKEKPNVRAKEKQEMFYVVTNQVAETLGVKVAHFNSLPTQFTKPKSDPKPTSPQEGKKSEAPSKTDADGSAHGHPHPPGSDHEH